MEKELLIEQLKLFRDKAFCHHSHYRAGQIWREIVKGIRIDPVHLEFARRIESEWQEAKSGHGFQQACGQLDFEVKNFISYLG